MNYEDYKKLNNFFWFFSLDLKSSKKTTQSVIINWIENNHKYNRKSWDFDLTSKRLISWLSNYKLTYEDGEENYITKFNYSIKKQTNHLLNEVKNYDLILSLILCCRILSLLNLNFYIIRIEKNSNFY